MYQIWSYMYFAEEKKEKLVAKPRIWQEKKMDSFT